MRNGERGSKRSGICRGLELHLLVAEHSDIDGYGAGANQNGQENGEEQDGLSGFVIAAASGTPDKILHQSHRQDWRMFEPFHC
jgi:hypothetical protein